MKPLFLWYSPFACGEIGGGRALSLGEIPRTGHQNEKSTRTVSAPRGRESLHADRSQAAVVLCRAYEPMRLRRRADCDAAHQNKAKSNFAISSRCEVWLVLYIKYSIIRRATELSGA